MDLNAYIGTWEVIGCSYIIGISNDNHGLEGIRFKLDENGDVTWTISEELKSVPLFNCETYEIYCTSGLTVVIRFGAYAGHVIEFRSESVEPRDKIILTCEGWVILNCKRIYKELNNENDYLTPFSLLSALENGYFSDMTLMASNKKEVHSIILQLQGSGIDWKSDPPPFSNLPEEVLGTILHYLYAECLPDLITEATARLVIDTVSPYPSLANLSNKCKVYLKNMAIKQQIIDLVNDMHNCMDQIIEHFNMRNTIVSNPGKLCFVIKQSIRDAAIFGAKWLLLCDLITQRKNELTRDTLEMIIRYSKSRLPIFLMQLQAFLQALKNTFSSMTAAQRLDVATFLVPEIEIIVDTISTLIDQIERALEQIINVLASDQTQAKSDDIGDTLSKSLKKALHIKELSKLRCFHEQISCTYLMLLHKQESFAEMSTAQKIRSIARNLEQLIEELPIFLSRLEEISTAFDEKLEWREFKFCFKVGTSKMSGIIQKLVAHRVMLRNVMLQLCELVQRDAFHQTLLTLGLLDSNFSSSNNVENEEENVSMPNRKHHSSKLNLVESLSIPPTANNSLLSKLLLEQLKEGTNTDMEFEIVIGGGSGCGAIGGATAIPHLENSQINNEEFENNSPDDEEKIIKAHRVIVAARCDWFRRALLSGMKESIDKKIIIHDTNFQQFKLFLEYLYSGKLNQSILCTEQLVELLFLSDRYEVDSLKQKCECSLKTSIDSDSALYFLSIADQYNAKILKKSCLNYITEHQELSESEIFFELPMALQAEIFDCIWTSTPARNSSTMEKLRPKSPNSESPDKHFMVDIRSFPFHPVDSVDELSSLQDTTRMEHCLEQLKDIIPGASQEELVQLVLAADYNLCRAVNFYYSQRSGDDDSDTT